MIREAILNNRKSVLHLVSKQRGVGYKVSAAPLFSTQLSVFGNCFHCDAVYYSKRDMGGSSK